MSFVIDGNDWRFDVASDRNEVARGVDELLEFVQVSKERDETIWIGDQFQSRPVFGALDFWSAFGRDGPLALAPEIMQELAAWLGAAPYYLNDEWPDGLEYVEIAIGDEPPAANEDVAWAHHNMRAGRAVGCIGLLREGRFATVSQVGSADVRLGAD